MDNKIVSLFLFVLFAGIAKHTAQPSVKVADSLYTIGDYSAAIKTYTEITPKSDHILAQMARSHKAKGTYDDALAFYQQAIETNPKALIAKMEYGKLLITTKNFQKANGIFEGLVAKHPENPDFQYQLGLTKETLKDSAAIYHYQKAFDLDQTHQKSCYKVAKHFLVRREFDSVVKYAQTGLSYYKNNVELISILGQNYYKMERFDKAIPYFLQLVELNYVNEFVYRYLATSFYKEYEYKEALQYYKLLLNYDDENPRLYNTLAEVSSKLKNYKDAEKYYLTAIELLDYNLDGEYYKLAMTYRFQEKWEDAIAYMKKAIKENPGNINAQYELAAFADAYYKDPEIKLSYYNKYLDKFGEKEDTNDKPTKVAFKRFIQERVQKRISQLEQEIATDSLGAKK